MNNESNIGKSKKVLLIVVCVVVALLFAGAIGVTYLYGYLDDKKYGADYNSAVALMEEGRFETAALKFVEMGDYKDARKLYSDCIYEVNLAEYNSAIELLEAGNYNEAYSKFIELKGFKDSEQMAQNSISTERLLYIQNLGKVVYEINKNKELAMSTINIVIRDWTAANKEGIDATEKLRSTYSEWGDTVAQLNIGKDKVMEMLSTVVELESASKAYDMVMSLYDDYIKLNDYAITPSGNLASYTNNTESISKDFDYIIGQLYVIESELKKQVEKEEVEEKKREAENADKIDINVVAYE